MSGGSHDYIYAKVVEAADHILYDNKDNALRVAFARHLKVVAKALHDIEWVDSCDYGEGDEVESIKEALGGEAAATESMLKVLVEQAETLSSKLTEVLKEVKNHER